MTRTEPQKSPRFGGLEGWRKRRARRMNIKMYLGAGPLAKVEFNQITKVKVKSHM